NRFADLARILPGRRLPIEFGEQLGGPNVGRRVLVARQAERHVERLFLMYLDHLINAAVATDAAYARGNMCLVIEVHEIGKLVDLDPGNRLTSGVALPNRLQTRAGRLHLGMAVHAGLRGRDRRIRRLVNGVVTIETVDAQLSRMQLVAVGDRLDRLES